MSFVEGLIEIFPKAARVYGHITSIRMSPKEKATSLLGVFTYLGLMSNGERFSRLITLNKQVDGPVCSISHFVGYFVYEAGNVVRRSGGGVIRKNGSWASINDVSNNIMIYDTNESEYWEDIIKTGNIIFNTKELRQDFYKKLIEDFSNVSYGRYSAIPFFKEMREVHAPNW